MRFPLQLSAWLLFVFLSVSLHAEPKKYRIAMVVPDGTSEFWQAVHAGAIKAQREYTNDTVTVDLIWVAPHHPNDLPEEINLFGDAVGSGVDGVAVAPLDPHALIPTVELAVRQKMPVVAMELPLDYPLITTSVATNNFQCGSEAAIIAGKLIKEKGKVLIIRHLSTDLTTIKRENGFLDGIRKYFDTVEVIAPDEYAGETEEGAYQLTKKLLKIHGNEISALFTSDPIVTHGAHRALVEAGMNDRIKHVGFLVGQEAFDAMKSGDLQGVIAPDPFNLGYLSLEAVYEFLRGKTIRPRIDVVEAAVTADNVNLPEVQQILMAPVDKYLPPSPAK